MQSLKRLLRDREEELPEEEPEAVVACRRAAEQDDAEAQCRKKALFNGSAGC